MKENNTIEIKYLDQKNDGLEAWIKKDSSNWVRLDFMLEYYISGNVDLSKQYRRQLEVKTVAKEYYNLLYSKFINSTLAGEKFDFQKYSLWQQTNHTDINNALALLNT